MDKKNKDMLCNKNKDMLCNKNTVEGFNSNTKTVEHMACKKGDACGKWNKEKTCKNGNKTYKCKDQCPNKKDRDWFGECKNTKVWMNRYQWR